MKKPIHFQFQIQNLFAYPDQIIEMDCDRTELFLDLILKILNKFSPPIGLEKISILDTAQQFLYFYEIRKITEFIAQNKGILFIITDRAAINGPNLLLNEDEVDDGRDLSEEEKALYFEATYSKAKAELDRNQFHPTDITSQTSEIGITKPPPSKYPPRQSSPSKSTSSSSRLGSPLPPPGGAKQPPGSPPSPVSLRGTIMNDLKDLFSKRKELEEIDVSEEDKEKDAPKDLSPLQKETMKELYRVDEDSGPISNFEGKAKNDKDVDPNKAANFLSKKVTATRDFGNVSRGQDNKEEESLRDEMMAELERLKRKYRDEGSEGISSNKGGKAANLLFSMLSSKSSKAPVPLEEQASGFSDVLEETQKYMEEFRHEMLEPAVQTLESELKPQVKTYKKNLAAEYFEVMNPEKYYPLILDISDAKIAHKATQENLFTGERSTQKQEEMVAELTSSIVTVRPVFPGCTITPSFIITDFDQTEDKLKFFITPMVTDDLPDCRVEFLNTENRVFHTIATPSKVDDPRYAKTIAAYGTFISILPKILILFGIDLGGELSIQDVLPLFSFLGGMNLTDFVGVGGAILAFIVGIIIWMRKKPKATKKVFKMTDLRSLVGS